MITINKGATNSVVFTLTEKSQLSQPFYLFDFIDDDKGVSNKFNMTDQSGYPRRFNLFELIEFSDRTPICRYVFASVPFNVSEDGVNTTFDIDATLDSGYLSSDPTFTSLSYTIDVYQSNVNTSSVSGTLLSGATTSVQFPFQNETYIVNYTLLFGDGGRLYIQNIAEVSGGNLTYTEFTNSTFPSIFDCGGIDDTAISMSGTDVVGQTKIVSPKYLDSDLNVVETGQVYDMIWISSDETVDITYSWGLDPSEWSDISTSIDIPASYGFKAGYSDVLNPSIGQVVLGYGWGTYSVYESMTQSLNVSDTTGRVLEVGRYYVNGYPVEYNGQTDSIYL